jgi:hypothetical protein
MARASLATRRSTPVSISESLMEDHPPQTLVFRIPVRRLSVTLACISLVLGASSAFVNFLKVNRIWRGFPMVGTFSADREHSLPSYFSASLLLVIAIAAFAIAIVRRKRLADAIVGWFGLGAIFALLSIDEGVALHERMVRRVSRILDARGFLTETEVIPGVLLAILFFATYSRFFRGLDRSVRRPLLFGFAFYGLGAIVFEMLGGLWSSAHGKDALYFIGFVTLEETLEMLGAVLLFYSVLSHLMLELELASLRVQRDVGSNPDVKDLTDVSRDSDHLAQRR